MVMLDKPKHSKKKKEDSLKIVLNVRDPKYISLLEQVKKEAGINYQNLIKFGILLFFRDEARAIKQFKKKSTEEIKEDSGLLKVHITFTGNLKNTIEVWKYRTGKTPQDIARLGLKRIFSFFEKEQIEQDPLNVGNEDTTYINNRLIEYLENGDKKTIFNFLKNND